MASPSPPRDTRRPRRREFPASSPAQPFTVVTWEPLDLSKALVVVGLPSVGLVGHIAAGHLVSQLQLREAGAVLSHALPPAAVVHDGLSTSPIRIYVGDVICGPDGSCDQLCVILSDVPPRAASIVALVDALVNWAKDRGARALVCLEGTVAGENLSQGEEARVQGVAADRAMRDLLGKLGIPPLGDGLFTGFGGVALYLARAKGLPALCLLAETREGFPDARGGARLLEVLQPLVPRLQVDRTPLYAAARALETAFRDRAEASANAAKELSDRADMMFG